MLPLETFGGMHKDEDFPDHKTLCNFGNDLEDADMLEVIFYQNKALLEVQNLKIQKGNIVIVETTVLQSVARSFEENAGGRNAGGIDREGS